MSKEKNVSMENTLDFEKILSVVHTAESGGRKTTEEDIMKSFPISAKNPKIDAVFLERFKKGPATFKEIGDKLGFSAERARQIQNMAIAILKRRVNGEYY